MRLWMIIKCVYITKLGTDLDCSSRVPNELCCIRTWSSLISVLSKITSVGRNHNQSTPSLKLARLYSHRLAYSSNLVEIRFHEVIVKVIWHWWRQRSHRKGCDKPTKFYNFLKRIKTPQDTTIFKAQWFDISCDVLFTQPSIARSRNDFLFFVYKYWRIMPLGRIVFVKCRPLDAQLLRYSRVQLYEAWTVK